MSSCRLSAAWEDFVCTVMRIFLADNFARGITPGVVYVNKIMFTLLQKELSLWSSNTATHSTSFPS